ncbi:glycosyltransferase family 2 protein [Edwardsiella tarda]|uniref:glycosyltransferase family 2 protein n=1 Tax=Edwardsiella tarda TaxID=636 RepID=UPI00351C92F8
MKVSIITATYNSESTIIDTLLSLKSQSYHNIEYIVIDGASRDNTVNLVMDIYPEVSHLISEPDSGIYDALNKGISVATGDVIGFLHSDDMFTYPDAISDIVNSFERNQVDAVYADLDYVDRLEPTKVIRRWKSRSHTLQDLSKGWMPPHPTFYMRKDIYKSLCGFDTQYRISADYESLLRYLLKGRIRTSYISKTLISMRVGGVSNRSLASMIKKSKEDINIMKKYGFFWPYTLIMKNISKLSQFW